MAEVTGIEWCDHTFNAWIGCTKLTAACDFCYAETYGHRFGVEWGPHERRRTSESYWREPLRWNRNAERDSIRRKVFCCSLADVFDNQVNPQWRIDLFRLIGATPHLDWLLLTKRPQNIAKMLPSGYVLSGQPPHNVWLGTTVENQEEADRRIPHLLEIKATVHFLSCEPLLGPLRLNGIDLGGQVGLAHGHTMDCLRGESWRWGAEGVRNDLVRGHRRIKWVISGGESGPHARPPMIGWARSLRDQCKASNVSFFWKQWGEYTPDDPAAEHTAMRRVGKKAAGALLDGIEHKEIPV